MPPPVPSPPVTYGPVFTAIEKRLKDRYKISIRDHIGDLVTPDMTGQIDPSLGGRIPALGGPRNVTIPGHVQRGKVLEGSTVLQGITFPPKNFQLLLELFREALNSQGKRAFHYHPLKLIPPGAIRSGLKKAEQFLSLDWLNLSYAATKVGMTKETEQLAWGFREIADTYNVEIGRVQSVTKSYPGENRFVLKFGQSPAAYARQVDITSLHVALTNAACNIHIDDVGFVLRGPGSGAGLNADFAQHLVDELLRGTYLRDWLATKYGSSSGAVWVVENLTIMLPSSDRRYAPTAGLKFEAGRAQFTAAFTMGCKCLRSERLTLEERLVPIPEGNSIGIGFRYDF